MVLVGLPGSGKTTAGRALAAALGRDFVDTDEVFARREHVSVQDYLREHSEASFRERELAALAEALSGAGVVATGGGVVTTVDARRLLGDELTVWLDCSDDELAARVIGGDRPLLDADPLTRLRELRAARGAFYAEVARHRVDSSAQVAALVARLRDLVDAAAAP